jgi:hypothetical protein
MLHHGLPPLLLCGALPPPLAITTQVPGHVIHTECTPPRLGSDRSEELTYLTIGGQYRTLERRLHVNMHRAV